VYRRVFVADGNFKADHVRPTHPSNDVWLSEGSGMFPKREEYFSFLKSAMERLTVRWIVGADANFFVLMTLQKAPCENTFRAITNALVASTSCDVTGIVAIACARHGCYAPNSIVDLFKGEQQKNVDFALLQSIDTTGVDPDQGLMLIYDIVCQYIIHLLDRIGHKLPIGIQIDCAIGLFHVHAHKEQCFFRYATSFIPGAGVTAGEILESLWSGLNGISPTTRTATLAHRAEVLDDHACDSNHKKMLGMTKSLCRRHKEASETLLHAEQYFNELSQAADMQAVQHWTQQIERAERTRLANPSVMDIYGARGADENADTAIPSAPSRNRSASDIWLEFALMIEEKQYVHCD
jgi:hypothetical protein